MTTREFMTIAGEHTALSLDALVKAADAVGGVNPRDLEMILRFVQEACVHVSDRIATELLQKGVLHDE